MDDAQRSVRPLWWAGIPEALRTFRDRQRRRPLLRLRSRNAPSFAEERVGDAGRLPTLTQWEPLLRRLTSDPSTLPGYSLLKYGEDGQVVRARLARSKFGLDLVCKQSRRRGLVSRWTAGFRQGHARRNFNRALELLRAGLRTPLPLVVIERRRPSAESWLVTAFVEGLVDLDQVALTLLPRLESGAAFRVKRAMQSAIVDLFDRMERNALTHRDLKASNLLLRNWNDVAGGVEVWLADLDGLGRRRVWRPSRRWKPLIRLGSSLLSSPSVTRTDYRRFLQAYLLRREMPLEQVRPLLRRLARQADVYVRRSQRRKAGKLDGYGAG